MKQIVYRPGSWLVIAEDAGVIAVPADTAPTRVTRLSDMLQQGAPALTEVIDALADGSITTLGSFAMALDGPDGTRFAVRGPVHVKIAGVADGGHVSGADVTTWSERFVAESRGFELLLDDSRAQAEYPLRSGVVLAGAVRVGDTSEEEVPLAVAADETASEAPADDAPAFAAPASEAPEIAEPEPDAAPEIAEPEPDAEIEIDPPAAPEQVATELIEQVDAEANVVAEPPAPQHTLMPSEFTYAPEPAADVTEDDEEAAPSIDDLFPDATVQVSPASAPPAPAAPPTPAAFGDHDGATISLAEARRLRDESSAPDAPTAVFDVVEQPAASAGRVRVSSGQVIELDRTIIIGRRPRATRASGTTLPHLVAVESPQQDISRSHLEIRPEGDSVVVIDLHTTNGSTLLRPGADPVRLHPGEHTLVLTGDVVDLGDGITVAFEGLA